MVHSVFVGDFFVRTATSSSTSAAMTLVPRRPDKGKENKEDDE